MAALRPFFLPNSKRPMTAIDYDVSVQRHFLRAQNAVVAVADFAGLFGAYAAHVRRWDLPMDPLGEVIMRQSLAGAALQMSFRVPEERSAWTLNLCDPALNAFVTGGGAENFLIGRYFVQDVRTEENSRLFVDRSHPKHEPTRSMVTVEGLDVFLILEQFFRRSEQVPARFLELSETRMVMIQGLPRADGEWISQLEQTEVEQLLTGEPEPIETRSFRLHCGCDGDRIARALVQFFRHDPEGLFEGGEGAETSCPRCGANWWIDRDLFERTAAAHPDLGTPD